MSLLGFLTRSIGNRRLSSSIVLYLNRCTHNKFMHTFSTKIRLKLHRKFKYMCTHAFPLYCRTISPQKHTKIPKTSYQYMDDRAITTIYENRDFS